MIWFWFFLFYSFVGFLLEVAFAWCTGGHPRRKCLLVLPLCPVYGLGACLILGASADLNSPAALFAVGAVLATASEYCMAAFYEDILGVSFWDYSDLPFHIHGRVCLPFSIAWGLLSIPLVRWLHPLVSSVSFDPPAFVTVLMVTALAADGLVSGLLLRKFRTRDVLDWYVRA
ncbi:MAG: putative ABC transporter permease [Clostridium sp.]|nr:putative ABC transporter permease [Clostridium sp.]